MNIRKFYSLKNATILALGLIAILAGITYYVLAGHTNVRGVSAALINISGKQRFLSQETALLSLELVTTTDLATREKLRERLLENADTMEKYHEGLLYGDETLSLHGDLSPTIRKMYFAKPYDIDQRVRRYIDEARALAHEPDDQLSIDNDHLVYILAEREVLLKYLDSVVTQHQLEGEQKLQHLQTLQTQILIIYLIVLAFEGIVIFRPVSRLIKSEKEKLELLNDHLNRLSSLDGLTGIPNRRYFDQQLDEEWRRGSRNSSPLSIIMLDIDYFKIYNDTYGHLKGDNCLKRVAETLSCSLQRAGDLVARYGGEEFVVILPNTDSDSALKVAENLRAKVADLAIEHENSIVAPRVTVSLGIATQIPAPEFSAAELLQAADNALYSAKQAGRDRAQLSSDYQV